MSLVQINSALNTDGYKLFHADQYNPSTTKIQVNATARKSRIKGVNKMLHIGTSLVFQNLVDMWDENFFSRDREEVLKEIESYLLIYTGSVYDTHRFGALHSLGYLPLEVKCLPEGELVPIGVPYVKLTNTLPEFFWLPNFLETTLSAYAWGPITAATIALEFKKILTKSIEISGGDPNFIPFQGHNFGMRGMMGLEGGILASLGHAAVFQGDDTVPTVFTLGKYYDAKTKFVHSIPATEHSVMCTNTGYYVALNDGNWDKVGEAEYEVFKDLLTLYPKGEISIVGDTWHLWNVITDYLARKEIYDIIMNREGTVVIRPDSGDPADIICGKDEVDVIIENKDDLSDFLLDAEEYDECTFLFENSYYIFKGSDITDFIREYGQDTYSQLSRTVDEYLAQGLIETYKPKIDNPAELKGVVELLWDIYGGTVNEKGFKQLNPKINVIYGDSITVDRCREICDRLIAKKFIPSIVFGIGSYTYQYNTRDTLGFAWKATWAIVDGLEIPIFKDPITDDGTKTSAKGFIKVGKKDDNYYLITDPIELKKSSCVMQLLFQDGEFYNLPQWDDIKKKVDEL